MNNRGSLNLIEKMEYGCGRSCLGGSTDVRFEALKGMRCSVPRSEIVQCGELEHT